MTYLFSSNTNVTGNVNIYNSNGQSISADTRLPVDIGNTSINISGNVNVNFPNVVTVNSSPDNPVHVHLTEIGQTNLMSYTYMPVGGNVSIFNSNGQSISANTRLPVDIGSTSTSPINTQLPDSTTTAFEEPLSVTITPIIQADSVYGLDPDIWNTTKLSNGNITLANSTWQVYSGTSTGGYARLATAKYMTYQPGQGSMFRWTAAFTTTGGTDKDAQGIDNIVQTTGPIDREDGYAIGYSGATANSTVRKIGLLHRFNGKAEIRQLTVTTAPTGTQTATITMNGVVFTITLTTSTSTARTAAQIAALLRADTVAGQQWDIDACGSIVTFTYYSPGSKGGAYSFSSTGAGTIAAASFSQLVAGVSPTDTWTYVDSWDNKSVSFDPTKLNVFGLDMRWLGAGIVRLFMENPANGKMTLMHTRKWSSSNTAPHTIKPSLRLVYRSGTTSGATPSQNTVVTGASVMGAIQGVISQTTGSQSYYNLDPSTRAKDTIWHLLSIQNPTTRNSIVNKTSLIMQNLSVATKSTDPAVIYVVKNATNTSDYIVFNPLPNASAFNFAQYSTTAVTETFSTDNIVFVSTLGINGSQGYDLTEYNLTLAPGEYISIFMSSTSSFQGSSVGFTWKVD